jgi:nucleoside-diphosphate-sugar epimerase
MKAVVTGASGFLGAHVVQRLAAAGWEVVAASRSGAVPAFSAPASNRAVRGLAVDLASDDSVSVLSAELGSDVALVHLAARWAGGADASAERRELMSVNVLGSLRAFEAARGRASAVVYASTCEVYGASSVPRPLTEADAVSPDSDHAVTKLTGEDHLFAFAEEQKQRGVALRFAPLYGRGARDGQGVSAYVHAVARGELPTLHGSGAETLDALHVSDAALAVELALSREVSGIFNVSDGSAHSARRVAELALRMAELRAEPVHLPDSVDRSHPGLDIARARSALGFASQMTLERGMGDQLLGLQSQGRA